MPPLSLGFQTDRKVKALHFSLKSCEHSNVDFKLFRLPFCASQCTAWLDSLLLINQRTELSKQSVKLRVYVKP